MDCPRNDSINLWHITGDTMVVYMISCGVCGMVDVKAFVREPDKGESCLDYTNECVEQCDLFHQLNSPGCKSTHLDAKLDLSKASKRTMDQ